MGVLIDVRGNRSPGAVFLAAVTAVCWLSVACAPGAQAAAPTEVTRFPPGNESGEAGGLLRLPTVIAASAVTGHVYVGESGNARISEFTSGGEFVRAWGWGVVRAGPGNKPQNEIQEVSVTATGGSFDLVFGNPLNDGGSFKQQTAAIGFEASAAEVETALLELESPVAGDVSVTSPNPIGGPWTIEFVGRYADTDVAPLEIADSTLVGTAAVTTVQGGANFEVCEAADGDECRAGQWGGFSAGELQGALVGLATGQDGSVFVLEQDGNNDNARIQKFQPDGRFELMFGGEVNKTTNADICTEADLEAGDECGRGLPGSTPGRFSVKGTSRPSRLAFGPGEVLNVGDENRISKYGPDGSFLADVPAAAGFVKNLATDAAGNFYVSYFAQENAFKLDPGGSPGTLASFPMSGPNTLSLDAAGNLFAIQDPPGFGSKLAEPRVAKFDPSGAKLIPTPEEETKGILFAEGANGLATLLCPVGKGLGALYVSDFSGHVTAYADPGSEPGCEVSPPKVTDRYAAAVGSDEATIAARINPNGHPTTYYVEYGTEPCETSSCVQEPLAPGKSLEDEGGVPVRREVELSGLSPETTYHYRVVAIGDSLPDESDEGTFTTRQAEPGGLPDGRGFEMVSPVEKNSADIAPLGGQNNSKMQAAETGPRLIYPSFTSFGDPEGAPSESVYLGRREAGNRWETENVSPRGAAGISQQFKAFSRDLSTEAIVSEEPLCCGAANGTENLYLKDLDTGGYELVTNVEPQLTVPKTEYCVGIQGFTSDFSRVFFKANGALTDDAPLGSNNDWNLYEWTEAGGIKLVSVLPGGPPETPATPTGSASFGQPTGCEAERIVDNAISADGSKAIWTDGSALYDRIDGSETVQLDLPQGGSGAAGSGKFWSASEDGSKVFFTASSLLVPGAHAEDLYRYDFDQPLGSRLTDLSASFSEANVQGVVGSSEAGDAIYFVAKGALAENEGPALDDKGNPEKAKAGQNNLYLWREGEGTRFIARLASVDNGADPSSDAAAWSEAISSRSGSTAPDADTLAFSSVEPLTGYESSAQGSGEQTRQVYLYDASADELVCASCNPTDQRPIGPDQPWQGSSQQPGLFSWKTTFVQPRYLSSDGGRLFFESFDALVTQDQNNARDVYEFERPGVGDCETTSPTYWASSGGCLALISSGTGSDDFFLDASATGDEVFISTAERLAQIDTDEKYDAYDVRLGAEAQIEPNPEPICDEVAIPCKPDPPAPPAIEPPVSIPPLGSGNVPSQKPCPKGKVRRKGHCVRKPCPKHKVRRKGRCVKKHDRHRHHKSHHRAARQNKGGAGR